VSEVIDPLNFESTSGFKPINSADVMGNESLLSFPNTYTYGRFDCIFLKLVP
jgi:hypothetical protein